MTLLFVPCSPAKYRHVNEGQPRKPKQPKAPVEKRTDARGHTVRYVAKPSQAVYQRIQRALPGGCCKLGLEGPFMGQPSILPSLALTVELAATVGIQTPPLSCCDTIILMRHCCYHYI